MLSTASLAYVGHEHTVSSFYDIEKLKSFRAFAGWPTNLKILFAAKGVINWARKSKIHVKQPLRSILVFCDVSFVECLCEYCGGCHHRAPLDRAGRLLSKQCN